MAGVETTVPGGEPCSSQGMRIQTYFNPLRSLRFLMARVAGRLGLWGKGVILGSNIDIIGRPIIESCSPGAIHIGSGSILCSTSFATALGVNHPVVLRTFRREAKIRIGEGVGISGGSICAVQYIEIGAGTMLGANVTIVDTDFHALSVANRAIKDHGDPSIASRPVFIGKNVFIGTNSIILKGASIGENSVIGAGSVVTCAVPANTIAAGNPCKVIRSLSESEVALAIPLKV